MRSRLRISILTAIAMLLAVSIPIPAVAAPYGWAITQVTHTTSGNNQGLRVSGDRIAWWNSIAPERVVTWKRGDSAPTTLSVNSWSQWDPVVSGDRIVWCANDGINEPIAMWRLGDVAPSMVTTYSQNQCAPVIDGDRLAWQGYDATDHPQIVTWKIGEAHPTTLTSDPIFNSMSDISGNRLVWRTQDAVGYGIRTWAQDDPAPTTIATLTNGVTGEPDVDGDRVVWSTVANDHYQVFEWTSHDTTPTQLTFGTTEAGPAQISGDRIVWASGTAICTIKADGSGLTTITADGDNRNPRIEGNLIVWSGTPVGGSPTVYLWNVGDSHPTALFSGALESDCRPQISGSRVVWNAQDVSGRLQVFTATPMTRTSVTKPGVSAKPRKRRTATFTSTLTPGAAALTATSRLSLWRWETKKVIKIVKGKRKRVTVHYWRLRKTITMGASANGKLTAKYKLPYSGKWKASVSFAGSTTYLPSSSSAKTFSAK